MPTYDADAATIEHMVAFVMRNQHEAVQRGFLGIWTVYDHPKDHPMSLIARMHCSGPGGQQIVTDLTLEVFGSGLEVLREVFSQAGLVCIPRDVGDDAKIVESWV
jgi:hypothetical protein